LGNLTVNVTVFGGSGAHTDWTIRVSGTVGPTGATGPGYAASSADSRTISNSASLSFTTQAGLAYTVGARVRVSSSASPTNWMEGLVTAYGGTSMTVQMDKSNGSGTFAAWDINIAGQPGAGDLTAANNLSDLASKAAGYDNLSIHGADIASA